MNDSSFPLVSICIPTYNRAENLGKALQSAAVQTYPNLEIIVVDNASTDETPGIVLEFVKKYAFIEYHKNEINIGAVKNFVYAASLARGSFFMWLADDDAIDSNYVSACIGAYRQDASLILVYGQVEYVVGASVQYRGQSINILSSSSVRRLIRYYLLVGDNSAFYGVHRNTDNPVEFVNQLGSDWFFVAAIAFRGKVKCIENTTLYRSAVGASSDLKKIAIELNEPKIVRSFPYLGVAIGAARQIVKDDSVYGEIGRPARVILAAIIFSCVVIKKIILQRGYRLISRVLKR